MNSKLKKIIAKLPKSPGVYKFHDRAGKIIYIGKATSLRDRVRSYFTGVHDRKTNSLVAEVSQIKFEKTDSVLEALILEANLIKNFQPKYNVKEKDDKSFSYFVITNEEFPRVLLIRKTELGKIKSKKIFGPYVSRKQMKVALGTIQKIFPFHSRKEKSEKKCLDFQIGKCPGPYEGKISRQDYRKNIRGIESLLSGKKKNLLRVLEKEMKENAKKQNFEKAAEIRNTIFALKHLQDTALLSEEMFQGPSSFSSQRIRIESYDISNIAGDYAVGSMVVFENERPEKTQYRKFKIRSVRGIDDVGMMKEVLQRRLRNDWPKPSLILLDGGKGHLNMAQKIINDWDLKIPIIAVAKGPTRKKLDVFASKNAFLFPNILSDPKLISKIRDEAHRFAIKYHRELRRKQWKKNFKE